VTGETVTAALMNVHVRDNLLETSAAQVTTAGDITHADAANSMIRLGIGGAGAVLTSDGSTPSWDATAFDQAFQIAGDVNSPNLTLSTSFQDIATIFFQKPFNWGDYEMAAWGNVAVDGATAGDTTEVRIEIGTSNGTAALEEHGDDKTGIGAAFSAASLTGDKTIAIAARKTDISHTSEARTGWIALVAHRET
jgi:hypothetical protein